MLNKFTSSILVLLIAITSISFSQKMGNKIEKHMLGNKHLNNVLIVKLKSNVDLSAVDNFAERVKTPSKYFGISSIDAMLQPSGAIKVTKLFPNSTKIMQSRAPKNVEKTEVAKKLETYYKISLDGNTPLERIKAKLERDPNVERVEYSNIYEAYDIPNDALYSSLQHLPQIKAPEAWNIHKGEKGPEVVIGIHDSGVQWDHPDLFQNLKINYNEWTNPKEPLFIDQNGRKVINPAAVDGMDSDGNGYVDDVIGYNFFTDDGTPENDPYGTNGNDHGTHVAGIAAGATNNSLGISSISWNVKFLPTKHGENADSPYIYNVEGGLWYMVAAGVNVVNMSWGGSSFSFMEADLFKYMNELGIVVISSAGNSFNDEISFPNSYPGILSISSVAKNDTKAFYSTYGIQADVSAPGGDSFIDGGIKSTIPDNSYANFQGTSMASPLVAGLAGLIKSYRPNWSANQIMKQIVGTADPIDALNPNFVGKLGSGRINAYRALTETNVSVSSAPRLASIGVNFYNQNGMSSISAGDDVNFDVLIRNFNQFADAGILVFKLSFNNPDVKAKSGNVVKTIKADDLVNLTGLQASVNPGAMPAIVDTKITVENLDGQKVAEFNIDFVIAGGILVYEYMPGSPNQSGSFIAQDLMSKGYKVVYSNKIPSSFMGFTSVFLSFGSYLDEPYYEATNAMFDALVNYIFNFGRIYIDGSSIFSDQIVPALDPVTLGYFFGLSNAYYMDEYVPFESVKGTMGSLAYGMEFKHTSQQSFYQEQYIPNPDFGGMAMLNEQSYGTIGVQTEGMFGQRLVLMSYALGGYQDNNCPSTKSNLLDNILSYFGEVKPITITMPGEFAMCKGAGSVVLTPGNTYDCATQSMKNLTVTGGSGDYTYDWNPKTNITYSNTMNPTVTNLNNNTSYKLTVTDNVFGITGEITTVVKVALPPVVSVRPLVQEKVNTFRNINSYIMNYSAANTYYWYKTSTANPIPAATAMSWKVPVGTTQLIVEAVNSTGCKSAQQKVIVYGSLLKENEDVVEGLTGNSLMIAYPTVTSDVINITAQFDSENSYRVSVVDLLGNVVMQGETGTGEGYDGSINVSNLTSGTYMLIIETSTDRLIKKFVKM